MKKYFFLLKILVMSLIFGITVIGCDNSDAINGGIGGGTSGGTSGGTGGETGGKYDNSLDFSNIQVYKADGVTPFTGSGGKVFIVANYLIIGDITNGKMTLNLPALPEIDPGNPEVGTGESVLLEPLGEMYISGLTISDPNVKTLGLTPISINYLTDGTWQGGRQSIEFSNGKNDNGIHEEIGLTYFSGDVTITGSNNQYGITHEYNITAKAGWNKIYTRTHASGAEGTEKPGSINIARANQTKSNLYTTDLSQAPSGFVWRFAASGSSGGEDTVKPLSIYGTWEWKDIDDENKYMILEINEDDTGTLSWNVPTEEGVEWNLFTMEIIDIEIVNSAPNHGTLIITFKKEGQMEFDFQFTMGDKGLVITGLIWDESDNPIDILFHRK